MSRLALILSIAAVVVSLLPPRHQKVLRHSLADFFMWQWVKGSKVSSKLYSFFWDEGNGKP